MDKARLNILFIEDNPEDVELAVLELGRKGFDISWERVDTEHGLRKVLTSWRPDIILSDHSMPVFNGLDALRITKEIVPDIPFIFVSGTIGEERAIDSIHRGATDYVLKDNLRRLGTSVDRAVQDSIERQHAQEVEKERSRLVAILEATSDLVVIANPDDTILYLNQGARKLLGLTRHMSELNIKDLHASWTWDFIKNEMRPIVIRDGIWQGEAVLVNGEGTEVPVSQVVLSHKGQNGQVEYFSIIARDIRDRKAYEKQIQYLANYDSLTDLPNRTLLADRAAQAISYCHRTNRTIAILVLNIDRFKLVNDGYGQGVGDALLKQFGDRLRTAVREGDTIARLSADSFSVLATELSSPNDVIMVVRKVQEGLRAPFTVDGRSLNITTGIGVSVYPRDGTDFATLMQNADVAMHRSKDQGESGFQFYASEMTRNAAERVGIENELRQAITRKELELYYQPQISISDGSVIGVEALMRWNHPGRGMVPPGLFIPIAENSELIYPIGDWALATACKQLKEWSEAGNDTLRVAVNVSARQFRGKGFPEMVGRILRATDIDPQRLELELTESVLVHDHEEAVKILNQLDQLGVKIALDDFGTGYSNLSYLSRLPLHYLKIDQSFVQRSLQDNNDAEIVGAIISLSDSLGLSVIAEGIETEEQLEFLRTHNCDIGQGYLFSRPVPAKMIPAILPVRSPRAPAMK
jgi:diguanylate cyclase (GGDEF)-like protein/PAS domain S-box-containing protein